MELTKKEYEALKCVAEGNVCEYGGANRAKSNATEETFALVDKGLVYSYLTGSAGMDERFRITEEGTAALAANAEEFENRVRARS